MTRMNLVDARLKPGSNPDLVAVFFRNVDEFRHKVHDYLGKNKIDYEGRLQGGLIVTHKNVIKKFKEAGFDFVFSETMEELCDLYKEDIENYNKQIRKEQYKYGSI